MGRHRLGIALGLIVTALGGGVFGYFVGKNSPGVVATTLNVSAGLAPYVAALVVAVFAGAVWGVGELVSGIFGFVERQTVVLRLLFAIIGAGVSVVTSSLSLLGISTFQPKPDSIFAFEPIATGLGAVALGLHALLHQIHLNRMSV